MGTAGSQAMVHHVTLDSDVPHGSTRSGGVSGLLEAELELSTPLDSVSFPALRCMDTMLRSRQRAPDEEGM